MSKQHGLLVKRSEFSLKKVTLKEDKSIKAEFIIGRHSNDGSFVCNGALSYDHQTSEKFQDDLHALHPYLCNIRGMKNEKHKDVSVKGIILSGSDDTENFKILGTELSEGGKSMGCDTCVVHYEESDYAWVDEVRPIAEQIEDNVFNYLFCGEKAEISMGLDTATETTDEDEPETEQEESEGIEEAETVEE